MPFLSLKFVVAGCFYVLLVKLSATRETHTHVHGVTGLTCTKTVFGHEKSRISHHHVRTVFNPRKKFLGPFHSFFSLQNLRLPIETSFTPQFQWKPDLSPGAGTAEPGILPNKLWTSIETVPLKVCATSLTLHERAECVV